MLKMRAPEGVTAFCHQGYPVEIGEDGAVHVDARHRADLEAHGFVSWDQPAAAVEASAAPMDPRRKRLVALFENRIAAMTDEEIAAMEANAQMQIDIEREDAERLDPDAVTVEDIDHMKRHELFALLKKRGIPAVPPIDNDMLRAKARATLSA